MAHTSKRFASAKKENPSDTATKKRATSLTCLRSSINFENRLEQTPLIRCEIIVKQGKNKDIPKIIVRFRVNVISSEEPAKMTSLGNYDLQKLLAPVATYYMGLRNRGTDCFVNSALNCLYFIPQFYDYFVNLELSSTKELTANLKSFVIRYGRELISPDLIAQIRGHSPKYNNQSMNSSYEFVLSLLESLDREATPDRLRRTERYGDNEVQNELIYYQSEVCKGMHDIFSVLVETVMTCSVCDEKTKNYYYQRSLYLDLVAEELQGRFILSLDTCLAAFTAKRTEDQENSHFCKQCNRYEVHTFESAIRHTGSALIIHLQRYHSLYPHSAVSIPRIICIGELGKFSLCSAILHSGYSAEGGHYTCLAKARDGWMCFNDSHISREVEPRCQRNLDKCTLFIYIKI